MTMKRYNIGLMDAYNSIVKSSKALNEGYVYDGSDEGFEDEEIEEPMSNMEQNKEMDNQNLANYDDRIAQIRKIAIEGLQEFAEDVNNPIYMFFKKIFLECDKACQEKQ